MRRGLIRTIVLVAATVGIGSVIAALVRRPEGGKRARYVGNDRSRVFHSPSCRYAETGSGMVVFATRTEAVGAGFHPCKICDP